MKQQKPESNRRDFIKTASAATAVAGIAPFAIGRSKGQRALETVNLGVVGTGGRGAGACNDSLTINDNVRLIAMGNLRPEKAAEKRDILKQAHGDKVQVEDHNIFGGLEAYEAIIDHPDVDCVLLTTSPGFRPWHVERAVNAGKHVFAEKPVCLDPAGWHACKRASDKAKEQGTAIVTGTQYRRQTNYVEAVDHINNGMIGDPLAATARYCSTGIWYRPREENMTDAEYQLRNWMHFIWLSGDQICEQAVHNIDLMNWIFGNPEVCYTTGGRFTRPDDSEMWDQMSVDYLYPGNRLVSFKCRQVPGTKSDADNVIYGSKGIAYIRAINGGTRIVDRTGKELYVADGNIGAAYRQEHKDLVDSIVSGDPIVELMPTADSSLTAAMGRMSAYSGQPVTWDFATKESKLDTFKHGITADQSIESPGAAIPGKWPLT
ncbi:MAG: dehydrogenase [Phycisphaerae bacterium]|nr:dehydrogenase [Phycisphaerae bacterium]